MPGLVKSHEHAARINDSRFMDAIRETIEEQGVIVLADAWLAAYAEELAFRFGLDYPDWIWEAERFLEVPYIHDAHSTRLKFWHTLKSPPAFTRRNLFVDFHLPKVALRRGRPRKSAAHKREMNRRRVARHRAKKSTTTRVIS